jgi:hypothetical protein
LTKARDIHTVTKAGNIYPVTKPSNIDGQIMMTVIDRQVTVSDGRPVVEAALQQRLALLVILGVILGFGSCC